jgi:acetyl-CoA carboxylase biotin carboxylase subunit
MGKLKKILIANRGEIVLRAIRTIKEMGKQAIVVYSTADKDALYVKQADVAVCIGSEKSVDSYLNIPAIIGATEITCADSIFPGYGFLSENQHFAEICRHHNLKFIGPSPETMILMSDKSKAKEVMIKAGIPVVLGSNGALKGVADAKKKAKEIGYPIILKAASGGGGRGMRVVEKESQVENSFLAAESEALSAFGDGRIYMEKYIKNPRHIEVQILDCSLQRRHQKLVEESPAVILNDEVRKKIQESAIKATKFIKYEGAGTFEFLVDSDLNFYFMEMNTRLQVEHTVSEMVSGLDLIELMIKIAEGGTLPKQEDINLKGHSIECRITAEDPKTFLPSPGKVTKWIVAGGKDVRVDSHIYQGYSVPPHYDSMIGKLIVFAENREKAIKKMYRALEEFQVEGIKTTIDFHKKIMKNSDFISNNFDTKYLENKMKKQKNK